MKRFSLGLAAIACVSSLTTYAALPTNAAPFQVNIPNLDSGLEFSATGYWLRPSSNNDDYAVIAPSIDALTASTTATYSIESVDLHHDWGYALMLGYIFPCSGNDIRLSWTHFDHSYDDSASADGTTYIVGPTFGIYDFFLDGSFTTASASERYKYDAVDLNVGQFVNLGTRLETRLFAGLRYAHLDKDLDETFTGTIDGVTPNYLVADFDSEFNGIGPLFGIDSSYHLGHCFGLVAHADVALLVGDVKSSASFTTPDFDEDDVIIGTNYTSLTADDNTRVVPGFDGKLGLDWTYPFTYGCNCDEAELSIEAGYQWTYYIDAVDQLTGSVDEAATVPSAVFSAERESTNIGFDGPYITLSLKL